MQEVQTPLETEEEEFQQRSKCCTYIRKYRLSILHDLCIKGSEMTLEEKEAMLKLLKLQKRYKRRGIR